MMIGDQRHSFFSPDLFNDEERLISQMTEQFIAKEIIPHSEAIETHDYGLVRSLLRKAGELGLLGIEVPEKYGGLSLSKTISGLVAEKMGSASSFSVSFNIHAGVGTLPYIYYGNEDQKNRYLPLISSGEWISAYALTEPSAGSDALNGKTKALPNVDRTLWSLKGEKQWITNAGIADVFVVFAQTDLGMTAFIVERSMDGVSIGAEEKKMGIRGSSTATLFLDEVTVSSKQILGEIGKGHKVALNIMNLARLKLAFANIGTSKQALQLSLLYGKDRKQFGQPLTDFKMIQEKLADMALFIYGGESLVYQTAHLIDLTMEAGDGNKSARLSSFAKQCAICKVYSSEALDCVVDEAVQIHGGYGYMQEFQVERLYRDARISRIFEGTNEMNRLTIAKEELKGKKVKGLSLQQRKWKNKRNQSFLLQAENVASIVSQLVKERLESPGEKQECMRMLADIQIGLARMQSVFHRSEQCEADSIQYTMAEIICEEEYRQIDHNARSIIYHVANGQEISILLEKLDSMPERSDIISKKRFIAAYLIEKEKYTL